MDYQGSFSSYSIEISPSSYPGPTPSSPYTRVVVLNPVLFAGHGTGMVFLNFVPAGRPLPTGGVRPDTESYVTFDLFPPLEDYPSIVDLVRNEGPLEFFFDDANPQGWYLRTSQEPVGEGESHPFDHG